MYSTGIFLNDYYAYIKVGGKQDFSSRQSRQIVAMTLTNATLNAKCYDNFINKFCLCMEPLTNSNNAMQGAAQGYSDLSYPKYSKVIG